MTLSHQMNIVFLCNLDIWGPAGDVIPHPEIDQSYIFSLKTPAICLQYRIGNQAASFFHVYGRIFGEPFQAHQESF